MQLTVQEITAESFAPYGSVLYPCEGHSSGEISFLPDRMLHFVGAPALDSLSTICIRYRPIVLSITEYHDDTEEVFGGFNHDLVFHVGHLKQNNTPDLNSLAMFKLPKGAFARVKRRVLHHAGFVLGKDDVAYGVVLLSPSAYTIDCKVIDFQNPIEVKL